MKEQRPQEAKWLDGDLTAWKRIQELNSKFSPSLALMTWPCSVDLCPSDFGTLTWPAHRMLWCVSSSDSNIDIHGCIPELDQKHGPGTRNICLENRVIPAISLIIPLCLGRWEWAPLTVSYDSFRAFSSVQFSHSVVSDSFQPHELQHARPPCPSPTPGVYSNPCPSSWWCHPAIASSVIPFSSFPQPLPASRSFPMSQVFTWGGQSIGVSASASVLLMNTQDWSPLGWTGWISL